MSSRKDIEEDSRVAIKDCWHPYGLQALSPEKFASTVSKILNGKHELLQIRYREMPQMN